MARYEIAPTRTNLQRLKSELSFAQEGYELLEQKREILIMELKRFTARATEAQAKLDAALERAYAALREAELDTGLTGVYTAGRAVTNPPEVTVGERRVMGVAIPSVTLSAEDQPPHYGPAWSSAWTDEAARRFREVLPLVADAAEAHIAVLRLAREIQKTIRRVNALEKILIPDYEESRRWVEDALEESDRDALFTLKLVKERLEAMGEAS
ncbi:MAG: V-type ATP synthase subunit D [Candidatus Hydrogenedentes bacterium]|nr:V-type ATP synthase subunit D [Candidatus Hydrogenedentota bacterium]